METHFPTYFKDFLNKSPGNTCYILTYNENIKDNYWQNIDCQHLLKMVENMNATNPIVWWNLEYDDRLIDDTILYFATARRDQVFKCSQPNIQGLKKDLASKGVKPN